MRLAFSPLPWIGLAGALGLCSGCGTGAVEGQGSSSSGAPADVRGTMIDRYYGEGAPVDQPVDLSGAEIAAFVWQDGAWTTFPGRGTAAGAFTVPDVPAGPFLIDVDGAYVYTTARTLDLGSERGGRPNAVWGKAHNAVVADLTGLDPWQGDDQIEWNAPNAGYSGSGFAYPGPEDGATAFSGQPRFWGGPLIDASEGDVLYVTQLSASGVTGAGVQTLSRYAAFAGVEQKDGTPVAVSGALGPVASTESISLDLRGSQFDALRAAVNPSAISVGTSTGIYTLPGGAGAGLFSTSPQLLTLDAGTDVKVSVPYANPFPAAWGEIVYTSTTWGVPIAAAGAPPKQQFSLVFTTMPAAQASTTALVPLVSPPLSPEIDGRPGFSTLAGVGLTPTLSWSAPAIGTPTAYQVSVWDVTGAVDYVATIVTTTESLTLPPGLLQSGHAYTFNITAIVSPIDATTRPFRGSPNLASADLQTGVVTP